MANFFMAAFGSPFYFPEPATEPKPSSSNQVIT
jgi:hypothetical protein